MSVVETDEPKTIGEWWAGRKERAAKVKEDKFREHEVARQAKINEEAAGLKATHDALAARQVELEATEEGKKVLADQKKMKFIDQLEYTISWYSPDPETNKKIFADKSVIYYILTENSLGERDCDIRHDAKSLPHTKTSSVYCKIVVPWLEYGGSFDELKAKHYTDDK